MSRIQRVAISAAALCFLTGCGGSEVPLGDVTGRVMMDGQPLPNALVRFMPEKGGRSSQGRTDSDGRYKLDYSARSEGALVGKAQVMITTGSLEDRTRRASETVPRKYNDDTELTAEVKRGSNELDFDLKTK